MRCWEIVFYHFRSNHSPFKADACHCSHGSCVQHLAFCVDSAGLGDQAGVVAVVAQADGRRHRAVGVLDAVSDGWKGGNIHEMIAVLAKETGGWEQQQQTKKTAATVETQITIDNFISIKSIFFLPVLQVPYLSPCCPGGHLQFGSCPKTLQTSDGSQGFRTAQGFWQILFTHAWSGGQSELASHSFWLQVS